MFSFTGKLEQADLVRDTHSSMLLLAWEVQLSQWGPGDRLTRGEFLCLGLGLKSHLLVTPDFAEEQKEYPAVTGVRKPPLILTGAVFVL